MLSAYPPAPHPNSRFLIVVIDDSATVRKMLETCLGREGFTVRTFPDGIEAMRWLASPQGRPPNLIFLDIQLPKMDGYAVSLKLKSKSEYQRTVVVMLTRHDGLKDRLLAWVAGAQDYLTKPFQTQDILAIVKKHLKIPNQDKH